MKQRLFCGKKKSKILKYVEGFNLLILSIVTLPIMFYSWEIVLLILFKNSLLLKVFPSRPMGSFSDTIVIIRDSLLSTSYGNSVNTCIFNIKQYDICEKFLNFLTKVNLKIN